MMDSLLTRKLIFCSCRYIIKAKHAQSCALSKIWYMVPFSRSSAGDYLLNLAPRSTDYPLSQHCINSSTQQRTVKTAHWKVQAYLPFTDTEFMPHPWLDWRALMFSSFSVSWRTPILGEPRSHRWQFPFTSSGENKNTPNLICLECSFPSWKAFHTTISSPNLTLDALSPSAILHPGDSSVTVSTHCHVIISMLLKGGE